MVGESRRGREKVGSDGVAPTVWGCAQTNAVACVCTRGYGNTHQLRNVQFQSKVLQIWVALQTASAGSISRLEKEQRERTTQDKPSKRSQRRKLDGATRTLDSEFGWQNLYSQVIEVTHLLAIVTAEGEEVFKRSCDIYLRRRLKQSPSMTTTTPNVENEGITARTTDAHAHKRSRMTGPLTMNVKR